MGVHPVFHRRQRTVKANQFRMLNEPSAFLPDDAAQDEPHVRSQDRAQDALTAQLASLVATVFDVYSVEHNPPPPVLVRFTGKLRIDSEAAYAQLDAQFDALDCHVLLATNEEGQHVIMAIKGRVRPRPRPLWPHMLLFVLTVLSLLLVGAMQATSGADDEGLFLLDGWPFALSMMLILGTHEFGHYIAARRHKMSVSLPYFIPFPLHIFGTLGAFILFREPMPNRKIMFDVGVAGPLAGLIVAVPVLLIGLATSHVEPLPQDEDYMVEGNSIFYAAAKYVVFGEFLPDDDKDVFVNQVAWAGWSGLLLTALNLIPAGQLDGEHIIYTLLGERARRLYWPLGAVFVFLSLLSSVWWLLAFLFFMFGRFYATPLDSITPLDARRRWIAYLALAIFVLIFVPLPLQMVAA